MNSIKTVIGLNILTSSQIERLHEASLEILTRIGVIVRNKEAITLLKEAGASVDGESIKIPRRLLEDALATVPKKIQIYDRAGNPVMLLEGKTAYFGTGSGCPSVIDPGTNEHRRSCKADVGRIARLCDGLDNIDFCMSMGIASDANRITSYVHQFDAMVRNTSKPILFTAHDDKDMRDIFDLATIVLNSAPEELKARPRYVLYNEPISPLFHTPEGIGKMLFAAEHNIPMIYIGTPMMGATSPVTMAGCIAQANAEALSGLVIQQLKKPGASFIYGTDASILDMKTMSFSYGAPELQMINIVFADLAHYYRLPLFCLAGATDSKIVDAQAGAEMATSILLSALNGCNLIHDVGYLESGLCSSIESIILADELIGMVKRYLNAFEISDGTLALDVIERVGPRGNFLNESHTLENFRKDVWFPKFFDRRNFENWNTGGAEAVTEPMRRKGIDILTTHQAPELSSQQVKMMDEILARRG